MKRKILVMKQKIGQVVGLLPIMPLRKCRRIVGQKYATKNLRNAVIWAGGEKPFQCDVCDKCLTTNGCLRRHIHCHTGNKPFECKECGQQFYQKGNLDRHRHICLEKTKKQRIVGQKYPMKNGRFFMWAGGEKPFQCDVCDKRLTSNCNLIRHQLCHTGDKPFDCKECDQRFSQKCNLDRHRRLTHDIGDHECELCYKKCARLRPCTDPATSIGCKTCRDCFAKVTGKDIRIEHEWSLYLDEHFCPEWRVCTDSRVGGESCSSYRPDGLWASSLIVLQWELDEHQHQGTSYDCDERRISELYDEFPGKQYVVVRVNPHSYKAPPKTIKPSQDERKALMLRVMQSCLDREWETPIHVVYMFYSTDNANITRNIGKTLLFDAKDVDAFCGVLLPNLESV